MTIVFPKKTHLLRSTDSICTKIKNNLTNEERGEITKLKIFKKIIVKCNTMKPKLHNNLSFSAYWCSKCTVWHSVFLFLA